MLQHFKVMNYCLILLRTFWCLNVMVVSILYKENSESPSHCNFFLVTSLMSLLFDSSINVRSLVVIAYR